MTSCPRCRRSFEDGVRFCPVDGAACTVGPSDPNLGRVLMDQFELREIAGQGSMGVVYRAYQRTMDRIVAVKILRAEIVKEPGVLRRFLREARAAARLQHPNIVTVHMVGETEDGVPYLVMENIDGVSLEAICEAQGPQPLVRVVSFARQIAAALSEAHSLGIVHRDLKPANILVTDRSRSPDLVKVLDFGIAKLVYPDAEQSIVSGDGTIFGTPHYIAPEQAAGTDVDHRVDLYSLGCILYRLTTGVLPFTGTQSMQVVLKHLREDPRPPRAIDASIPPALEELILTCLQKQRQRRPEDAEQIIVALDRIEAEAKRAASHKSAPKLAAPPATATLKGMPPGIRVHTPPKGRSASTGKMAALRSPWRSRTVWVGVGLAALVGGTVGVLAALTHNSAEESVPPTPEHQAARAPHPSEAAPAPSPAPATLTATTTTTAAASAPATASPESAAHRELKRVRRGRRGDDDLPMTVVAPDPSPHVIAAAPSPPLSSPPGTSGPSSSSAPSAPSSGGSSTSSGSRSLPSVVVTPTPVPTQKPPPPKDDEPPPSPPPPSSDPTTLPAPAPTN